VIEAPAYSSVGPVVIYFAAVVAAMAIILAVIPLWALRYALRLLFALLFSWGAFILGVFYLPLPVAIIIAVAFGAAWFLVPLVWLHNLVLIMALTALGAVFGRFIAPWTAVVLIVILAVYDFLAVRFGFMIWMADKLANTDALPALVIPRNHKEWGLNLKHDGIRGLNEEKPAGHRYSILGGGDIAFPGLLTASVYFSQGLTPAIIIAFCGLAGLIGAYTMQACFLK
jgi:presenilin-like A22 family membrane protease